MVGDSKAVMGQCNAALNGRQWFYPKDTPWRAALAEKAAANAAAIQPQIDDDSSPFNYYRALKDTSMLLRRMSTTKTRR